LDRRGSLIGSLVFALDDEKTGLANRIKELENELKEPTLVNPASVHNNLANALMNSGQIEEAIKHYQKALELNEEDAAAYMNLGVAYKHLSLFDKALDYFKKSLEIRPTADEHYNMANTFLKLEPPDFGSAVEHYKEALRMDPNHADCHQNLGLVLKGEGKIDAAIMELRSALKLSEGSDVNAHYNLGNALVSKADALEGEAKGKAVAEAIEHYKEALSLSPDDPDIKTNLAIAFQKQGYGAEAVRQYLDVMKLQPGDAMTHFNCGNALLLQNDYQGAIDQFKESMILDKGCLDSQFNLGMTLMQAGEFEEACNTLEDYLESTSNDREERDNVEPGGVDDELPDEELAHIKYNLGVMYSKLGKPAESKEALLRSIELKPGNAYAHLNLGNQEVALGNKESGMAQFKLACSASPGDASLLLNVAYALIDDGSISEAAHYLRLALEIDPDDDEARHTLDQVSREVEAEKMLRSKVEEGEALVGTAEGAADVRARVGLANSYRSLGRLDDAAAQLREALALQPGHPQISQMYEEVAAAAAAAAKSQPAMKDQELVQATGRFSLFAGKKKGRGKKSSKAGGGSSPKKKKGKVGVAG